MSLLPPQPDGPPQPLLPKAPLPDGMPHLAVERVADPWHEVLRCSSGGDKLTQAVVQCCLRECFCAALCSDFECEGGECKLLCGGACMTASAAVNAGFAEPQRLLCLQ